MSQDKTISNLLWALNELGVKYLPQQNKFEVALGNQKVAYFDTSVAAASARMQYLRSREVQATCTYPNLVEKYADKLDNELIPQLKASNIEVWKKRLEEALDELVFCVRKTKSTSQEVT